MAEANGTTSTANPETDQGDDYDERFREASHQIMLSFFASLNQAMSPPTTSTARAPKRRREEEDDAPQRPPQPGARIERTEHQGEDRGEEENLEEGNNYEEEVEDEEEEMDSHSLEEDSVEGEETDLASEEQRLEDNYDGYLMADAHPEMIEDDRVEETPNQRLMRLASFSNVGIGPPPAYHAPPPNYEELSALQIVDPIQEMHSSVFDQSRDSPPPYEEVWQTQNNVIQVRSPTSLIINQDFPPPYNSIPH